VTVPLPIPDDPRIGEALRDWNHGEYEQYVWPRSQWLGNLEYVLREHYPQASSDELTLTARNLAPFPLALPNVP
jgi:hypothetical protein